MTGIAGDVQLVHAVKASASARAPSSRTSGLHYRSGWFWCTGGSESTALLKLWRRPTSPNTLLLTCISGSRKCAPQNWCPRAFSLADLVALFKLTKVLFDISQRYMIRSQTMSCIGHKLTLSQITTETLRLCNDPRSLGFQTCGLWSISGSGLHGGGAEQDRSHALANHPGTCSSSDHCILWQVECLPPAPGPAKYSTSKL